MYFGFYTCITELILVFQIIYMSYRAYTCLTDFYTCFAELIIVLRILFLCEGTRRYDKLEQIRIIAHTRSDQTYTDTDISLS